MKPIFIEIGYGELLDRISILEVKSRKIASVAKQRHIVHELNALLRAMYERDSRVPKELTELRKVNAELWDAVAAMSDPSTASYGAAGLEVERLNRKRAMIKREADARVGSIQSEQKA